jgi:hypothetical protein
MSDKQILEILKVEHSDIYNAIVKRLTCEQTKPKTYKTQFKKISRYTTKEKLEKYEDMGYDALYVEFLERCKKYSEGNCKQWLYIPEMMHVLSSMTYETTAMKKMTVLEMREHWKNMQLLKKGIKPVTNQDNFIDDE